MIDFREDEHSLLHPKQNKRNVEFRTENLPDLELSFGNGIRRGDKRCGQLGLIRGDCQEEHMNGKLYCYYHEKVVSGKIEPPQEMYPVWPVPNYPWQFVTDYI